MPEGTRVHRCVDKLKGKRGVNPYAVCQASTGQSFATGKPVKAKTKAAPPPEPEMEEEPGMDANTTPADDSMPMTPGEPEAPEVGMEEEGQEPYGGQVLRRIHQDHMILMEEYDEMQQLLEHEGVKSHLQSRLEECEKVLTATEELFEQEYSHLEGLEGGGTRPGVAEAPGEEAAVEEGEEEAAPEVDEEAIEADSGAPPGEKSEEEGEDEEKEGEMPSKKKSMGSLLHSVKNIRARMKGVCPECGMKECSCKAMPRGNQSWRTIAKPSGRRSDGQGRGHIGQTHMNIMGSKQEGGKPYKPKRRPSRGMKSAPVPDGGNLGTEGGNTGELPAHHKRAATNAHTFLHVVAHCQDQDWSDAHRSEAYHHGRSLTDAIEEAMGDVGMKGVVGGAVGGTAAGATLGPEAIPVGYEVGSRAEDYLRGGKKGVGGMVGGAVGGVAGPVGAMAGGAVGDELSGGGGEEQKSMSPHYGTLKDAASFFSELSQVKDFSESYRQKAMEWHKAMDPICAAAQEVNVSEPQQDDLGVGAVEPMQQMATKALAYDISRQNEEAKKLAETLNGLISRFN